MKYITFKMIYIFSCMYHHFFQTSSEFLNDETYQSIEISDKCQKRVSELFLKERQFEPAISRIEVQQKGIFV